MSHRERHMNNRPPRLRRWRAEAGVGVVEVLVITGIAIAVLSVGGPYIRDTVDKQVLKRCVALNVQRQNELEQLKSEKGPDAQLPADSPVVTEVTKCIQSSTEILNRQLGQGNPQAQQLQSLSQQLQEAGQCRIVSINPKHDKVGKVVSVAVQAYIPFTGVQATAALTSSPVVGSDTFPLTRDADFNWSGSIALDGKAAQPKTNSEISFTASSAGGSSCSAQNPLTFTWDPAEPPEIKAFTAQPAKPGDKKVTLSWVITNAETASITNVGPVDAKSKPGLLLIDAPQQDTEYTLTAVGPGGTTSKTVTVHPVPQGAYTVTLSAGRAGTVTSDSATIEGTVTPAPPAGTTVNVAIGVNGNLAATVAVNSDGSFVAVVPLEKKATVGDLSLDAPGLPVTSCGDVASPITLKNNKGAADLANVINAAVVAAEGGANSNIATLTVYQAVEVLSFRVEWSGCPAPTQTGSGGAVLGPNAQQTIGQVTCGTPCPGHGTQCTGTATVTVATSVGSLYTVSPWSVNIP